MESDLTELLKLYKSFPCLWNVSCEEYRDKEKKSDAWKTLSEKFKQIEPLADITQTKKKIENMRSAYKREFKKVEKSKHYGVKEVHIPNLWYFDLLKFLDGNNKHDCEEINNDPLASDEEPETVTSKRKSSIASKNKDIKKQKNAAPILASYLESGKEQYKVGDALIENSIEIEQKYKVPDPNIANYIETPQDIPKTPAPIIVSILENGQEKAAVPLATLETNNKKPNAFGIYVGEKVAKLIPGQKEIAEKLISDVLFLASMGKLQFDTNIQTPLQYQPIYQPTAISLFQSPQTVQTPPSTASIIIKNEVCESVGQDT